MINDYEVASYFYNRCLDIAKENKNLIEEAKAYKGLGICEQQVFNIFQSMKYLEIAYEKAIDANTHSSESQQKAISKDLVKVYEEIAKEYESKRLFEQSLEYYEKCLESCKKANNTSKEAECYFSIGLINEKMGDLNEAVLNVTKYLEICTDENKS